MGCGGGMEQAPGQGREHGGTAEPRRYCGAKLQRPQWVWAQPEPLLGARGLDVTVRVMEGLAAPRKVCECCDFSFSRITLLPTEG